MKTEPTNVDREAVNMFLCVDGMRAGWGFRSLTDWSWERVTRDGEKPGAIDTNDPATVGAMLAQVEAAAPGCAVTIADRGHSLPGNGDRRFLVLVDHAEGHQTTATGPTRGAALVAAMRKLKGVDHGQ